MSELLSEFVEFLEFVQECGGEGGTPGPCPESESHPTKFADIAYGSGTQRQKVAAYKEHVAEVKAELASKFRGTADAAAAEIAAKTGAPKEKVAAFLHRGTDRMAHDLATANHEDFSAAIWNAKGALPDEIAATRASLPLTITQAAHDGAVDNHLLWRLDGKFGRHEEAVKAIVRKHFGIVAESLQECQAPILPVPNVQECDTPILPVPNIPQSHPGILQLPNVPQQYGFDCGPAAVASIVKFFFKDDSRTEDDFISELAGVLREARD